MNEQEIEEMLEFARADGYLQGLKDARREPCQDCGGNFGEADGVERWVHPA